MEDPSTNRDASQVLHVLEALKQASHELEAHPSSNSIEALLELQTESNSILSNDPNLSTLSHRLADLKNLVETLQKSRGYSLTSFLSRRFSTHSISRVAGSIETEIQAWIDRERIEKLAEALDDPGNNEDELVELLTQFEDRLLRGFNRELQDLVLKSKILLSLETILCNPSFSKVLREHSAYSITALIKFNKDVFVGQVSLGHTVRALLSISSTHSMKVLCTLIKSIKSPLVDEIQSNNDIPKIIDLLDVKDLEMQVLAMDCILEIGYFGRKEAIEAMLEHGLVKKLVELQRSEMGGDLIEIEKEIIINGGGDGGGGGGVVERRKKGSKEKRFMENHPFASCVARFAVQLEVGEGLRQREKRAFKQDILVRVREASISDAQAATIIAEVLWGSSP